MPMTEQQLSAMIDAAVREAVERTARELTAKHEAETEGLRRKRDELLTEKAQGKKPWQDSLDAADAMLARSEETLRKAREQEQRWSGKSNASSITSSNQLTITREEARDGSKYREAKAAAEKAGVPLRIVDEQAPAQAGRRSSPVKYVSDADAGVLYANVELVERHGQTRMRQLAAEKGATLRVFRSVDDLPQPMQQAHAQAIADRAPGTLLEGGE